MPLNISTTPSVTSAVMEAPPVDIETLLLAVQTMRVRLMDVQLDSQMKEIRIRNDHIKLRNDLQNALNAAKEKFAPDAKPDSSISDPKIIRAIKAAMKEAGYHEPVIEDKISFSQVNTLLQDVKSSIDGLGNAQQMDMLRLQSTANKRNESFDLMSTAVKKFQDSRSGIIANWR